MVKQSSKVRKAAPQVASDDRPVALTLKIDTKTYLRLATLGATQRRTHQDILHSALEEYLKSLFHNSPKMQVQLHLECYVTLPHAAGLGKFPLEHEEQW